MRSIVCQRDQTWSSVPTGCQRSGCPAIISENNLVTDGVVSKTCPRGDLEKLGAFQRAIECSTRGVWSGANQLCGSGPQT